ncbi:hypothetical protein EXD76_03785 [BEV proteobacterium]|nr:hypothetical protein [Candidatus Symbiopectobacterium sp. Chty_BC]
MITQTFYLFNKAAFSTKTGLAKQHDSLLFNNARAILTPAVHFFWLAGEDRVVVQLRRYVRRELKVERNQLDPVPYWREGLNEEDYHQKRDNVMDNPDD